MKHPADIAIADYSYELPQEKIAAFPLDAREKSKLLVYRQEQIEESTFEQVGAYLPPNALLVFNDTRVISARLNFFTDAGKPIEVFCLEPWEQGLQPARAMQAKGRVRWRCLVGHLRHWKQEELLLNHKELQLKAVIAEKQQGYVDIDFSWAPAALSFLEAVQTAGQIPIPPYLKRSSTAIDEQRYQTVYASASGSVAAPTAGLHFTPELLTALEEKGMQSLRVTLHVGAGTFMPVKSELLKNHAMHAEWISVDRAAIEILSRNGGNTIAVGTTSLRTIESLYWIGLKVMRNPGLGMQQLDVGQWEPYEGGVPEIPAAQSLQALLAWMELTGAGTLTCRTSILIAPPYELKVARGIITNFHQPQSTLLLLIASVVGNSWKSIYDYALAGGFRFLSYGDSSLLLK